MPVARLADLQLKTSLACLHTIEAVCLFVRDRMRRAYQTQSCDFFFFLFPVYFPTVFLSLARSTPWTGSEISLIRGLTVSLSLVLGGSCFTHKPTQSVEVVCCHGSSVSGLETKKSNF